MRSKLLGKIHLDSQLAEEEAQLILECDGIDESSEFSYGKWRSYVLWNETGDAKDTAVRKYRGAARCTRTGTKLRYLNSVLGAALSTEHIKWVRAFAVSDGILAPHRNLWESCRSLKRLSFPIRTDSGCLHSENDCVFHMRLGEVWYFDDLGVHAACSMSPFTRVLICIDFDLPEGPLENAFCPAANAIEPAEPFIPYREPIDARFLQTVYSLSTVICWQNIRDVLQLLIKVHFYRDVPAIACYDWLVEIAARAQMPKLLQRVTEFKRFCLEARAPYETFEWDAESGWLRQRISGP